MANPLIEKLRATTKDNSFDSNGTILSYKSGIPILDYHLGYKVNVFDKNDYQYSYPLIGIPGGSFITAIGKPSTTKTTTMTQIAANIVRPFQSGTVIHYDLEQAMNYSRIQALTKFTMADMDEGKYILRQENNTIDDIYESIIEIYKEKVDNPDKYKYNTGVKDEFNKDIWMFEPTVIIIDSIAALSQRVNENSKSEFKKVQELEGNTFANRVARDISQFYTKLLPRIRTANIIVLSINQIKTKVDIGLTKSAASILYLKQDETFNLIEAI